MVALLLPLSFILTFLNLYSRAPDSDRRVIYLKTCIIWGTAVVIGSECLSLFQALSFGWLTLFWGIYSIALMTFTVPRLRENPSHLKSLQTIPEFTTPEKTFLIWVGVIAFMLSFIAFRAPPNTWDSMTYHMPRVAHWMQNQTLASYPTSILRQITYPPGAEVFILQFQILSRGDLWANFIQVFSYLSCLVGVSLIAGQLGGSRRAQILATVITATIPMGILQGSGTQNDFVISLWLICFVYFLIEVVKSETFRPVLYAGLAAGLALFSKLSAYLYAPVFGLWFFIRGCRKDWKKTFQFTGIILVLALALNLGHYTRQYTLMHNLTGPIGEAEAAVNRDFRPQAVISTAVRNIGIHMPTPIIPLNRWMEKWVYALHDLLQINPNDTEHSYGEHEFYIVEVNFHEDYAGNLLHTLAIFVAVFLLFRYGRKFPPGVLSAGGYFALVGAAFLVFCTLLKWQPWHSRLMLPLFILAAPALGVIFTANKNDKVFIVTGLVFLLCAMPWAFNNKSRSFFKRRNIFNSTRLSQQFYNKHGYMPSYMMAVEEVQKAGCSDVGILIGIDTWEYPMWTLFSDSKKPFRLEHVKVNSIKNYSSSAYPLGKFDPCAIISDDLTSPPSLEFDGNTFVKTRKLAYLSAYLRDDSGALVKKSLLFHLNETLQLSAKANVLINLSKADNEIDPREMAQLMNLREEQLKEARQVNLEELDKVLPGFGNIFAETYLAGLELLTEGYREKNKTDYDRGQFLILQWETWLSRNMGRIKTVFDALAQELQAHP